MGAGITRNFRFLYGTQEAEPSVHPEPLFLFMAVATSGALCIRCYVLRPASGPSSDKI